MELTILSPLSVASLSVLGLSIVFYLLKKLTKNSIPYPPGPPGEPLVGHLRVIPFEAPYQSYLEWGKQYSKLAPSLLDV